MRSTTVHSEKNTVGLAIVAGSALKVTERDLEIPPKKQVFEVVSSYIEEQGNIEIAAEDGYVTENGDLVKKDGSVSKMSAQAYKNIDLARKERAKRSPKKQKQTEQSER